MNSQTAITLLKNLEQCLDSYCELNDEGKTAFNMAISALELFGNSEQLPSVHPELSNNSKELENKNGELISRQEAKDAIDMALDHIDHVPPWVYDKLLNALNEVPSAQPKIIRCKDCKWFNKPGCSIWIVDDSDKPSEDDYCSFAELRGDSDEVD